MYWCGPLPPSGVAVNVTGTVAACGAVLSATSVTSLTVLEFAVVVGTGFAAAALAAAVIPNAVEALASSASAVLPALRTRAATK